ncbi:MAG TPA: hypothetical protein VHY83_09360 [Solirubrobacteraceae bacterium]|nr:hypothetical protein [Solirubrobacteraceae bacterium]
MGEGKSGSTILGVALGNCDGVLYAGELSNWLAQSGTPLLGGSERVRFWKAVRRDVDGADGLFGSEAYECLERGLSAFRIDRWQRRRGLRPLYRQVTESLYRSIASNAGVTHIVDTSHLPMRARELQSIDGLELYLIFLVRDVEGVVASHTRHLKRRQVAKRRLLLVKVNARLWTKYLMSIVVFLRQTPDRRLLLRHEDFLANPRAVLREVLDFADSSAAIPDLSSLSTGIPLEGNPLVRKQVVALKADPAPALRPSRFMRMAQRGWTVILDRLQPAATGARSPEHVAASDSS